MFNVKYINNIRNPYYNNINTNPTNKKETEISYQEQQYLNHLIEQFKKATKTENIDINSPEFIMDLNNWVARNNWIGMTSCFSNLEELGIYTDRATCAEIGKGYRDSLAMFSDTTIITPYSKRLENREGKTITSEFNIEYGTPMIYEDKEMVPERIIKPTEIDTFFTHNPYIDTNINSWAYIHQNNAYNGIIIGAYGNTEDKDMDEKIQKLIKLRKILEDNYIYEDFSFGDSYCHILATDTRKKRVRGLK